MKLLGLVLAVLALVFAVVSGMSVGGARADLQKSHEHDKAGCNGGGRPPSGQSTQAPPQGNATG